MMQRALPPQNRIFRDFLQRGLNVEHPRTPFLAELHEFEDCRYKLERWVYYSDATVCFATAVGSGLAVLRRSKEAPDVMKASFAHSYALPEAAESTLHTEYEGIATPAVEPEAGYQLTLHVRAVPESEWQVGCAFRTCGHECWRPAGVCTSTTVTARGAARRRARQTGSREVVCRGGHTAVRWPSVNQHRLLFYSLQDICLCKHKQYDAKVYLLGESCKIRRLGKRADSS